MEWHLTYKNLEGLPFKNARDLKEAKDAIHLQVWRRLEEAKRCDEMSIRPEYRFWGEEFKEGLVCCYGEQGENLVRVFSEGKGIKININRKLADSAPSSDTLLGVLVKSMSESSAKTFYQAKGILPTDSGTGTERKPKTERQ